jgi:hypothetical protein
MARVVFPRPRYALWRRRVDTLLRDYTGRALCDLPISDYPLVTWWGHGVPAATVAACLALLPVPPVATFTASYCDGRVQAVRQSIFPNH